MDIPSEWTIEPVEHDGQKRLAIRFANTKEWNDLVRLLVGVRWSQRMRCWHVFDNKDNRDLLRIKAVDNTVLAIEKDVLLSVSHQEEIKQFILWMRNKRYSERTIHVYSNVLKLFLFHINKSSSEITNQDVLEFNEHYVLQKKLSATYQSQFINALKLFHQTIHKSKLQVEALIRPKKGRQLPKVISEQEVEAIINACENLKHKCMLSLIYSAGLRRSELINMKRTDISRERKVILIRNAKGMKDRIVPLSTTVTEMLDTYEVDFKPKEYLFEGQYGNQYSERSLEEVLKKATRIANIQKNVNLHMLRHSYATHLMEAGTNLRHIQELLGHKSPKTTQIYTHVSRDQISKIVSPLDRLRLKK